MAEHDEEGLEEEDAELAELDRLRLEATEAYIAGDPNAGTLALAYIEREAAYLLKYEENPYAEEG